MSSLLESLQQLQEIETQLAAIRKQREVRQKRVEALQRQVLAAERRAGQHHQMIREKQVRQDALSLEVTTREEAIAHQREALSKAKTNKSYAEILTAINTTKADTSKLESSVLQLMEEIQALEQDGKAFDVEQRALAEKVEAAEAKLREFDEEHSGDRKRLEGLREQHAANVPPSALNSFNRVAAHHDGEALASVIRLHPKRHEYACAGCNMTLTLEIVNALHKPDEMQYCNSCGRVLYLEGAVV
ncbi:MAG: zinc ribbon domain-containing protein [Phycisphaerae bacterium]